MASEEETDKELNEILKQAKIEASKSDEEREKEVTQAIRNFTLSRQVFSLFDSAIEKRKKEIGKTDQEISLHKIPTYSELMSSLAPMLKNRLSPKQIYMSPVMAAAIDDCENDLKLRTLKKTELFHGLEVYKTLGVENDVIYALPDPDLTGVMAIPRFGVLFIKDEVCLKNYADFPDDIKRNALLHLTNIEAPYKITVPQRWIDDYCKAFHY